MDAPKTEIQFEPLNQAMASLLLALGTLVDAQEARQGQAAILQGIAGKGPTALGLYLRQDPQGLVPRDPSETARMAVGVHAAAERLHAAALLHLARAR